MTTNTFEGFGLPSMLADALVRMEYTTPTPIQMKAIPFALDGRDIMGSAQTGTGKTAAFCIPMIAALMNDPRSSAMVMTPTRELAMQVLDVARQMIAKGSNIRTALLIGGEPMGKQFKQLNDRPRLIVGTPGRMNDHLRRQPDLFENTNFVVLDEADRMLDMGFSAQIDTILAAAQAERQTLMFSATFPPKIEKFARTYLQNPQRVEIESAKVSAENITHDMVPVTQERKYDFLRAELETRMGTVIVFVKTKHGADKLAGKLHNDGQAATALHGGLNQRQRERTIRAFRKMDYRVLVATDVAARGLDVPHVEHVINYDMPMVAEDYIHRIGRTARAGAKGSALAIVAPHDEELWRDVECVMYPNRAPAKRTGEPRSGGRPGGRKPFGKAPFKKTGYPKAGFKKREGGEFSSRDGEQRPRRQEGARDGYRKPQDENRGERNYAGRSGFNDRPRGQQGENREGRKFEGKPFKRPARQSDEGFSHSMEKPRGYKPRTDKPAEGKPRFDKANGKPSGFKKRDDKPQGGKSRADKPASRRGAARYQPAGTTKPTGKPGFKKRRAA